MKKERKKEMKRIVYTVFLTLIFLCSMSGCGKRKVDYTDIDTKTDEADTGSEAAEETGTDPGDITEETWQTEFDVNSENTILEHVKIDADIVVPETDSLSVVSVKPVYFDEAYKKDFLSKIYDNGAAYIYDFEIGEGTKDISSDYHEDVYVGEIDGKSYISIFESGEDDGILIEECGGLKSTILLQNGETYPSDDPIADQIRKENSSRKLMIQAEDIADACPEEFESADECQITPGRYYSYSEDTDQLDNRCSMSEGEAVSKTEDFLTKLDFSDMELQSVEPLIFSNGPFGGQTYVWDGYCLFFTRQANGVTIVDEFTDYYQKREIDGWDYEAYGNMNSALRVYINDNGILQLEYVNPMKEEERTEDVSILPLENVQNIMQEILENDPDSVFSTATTGNYIFDQMELTYMRLRGEDESYSYVPVWQLSDVSGKFSETNHVWLIVNAIDGTQIDLFYELTGLTE